MTKKNSRHYHYTDCGLDYIYLVNGYKVLEDERFGALVAIHDIDGLHKSILKLIVNKAPCLRGQEIRFIRSFLKLSQTQLGFLVGKDMRTIQRWEKEGQKPIPEALDKFLRIFLTAHLDKDELTHKVCETLKDIKEEDFEEKEKAKKQCEPVFNNIELQDTNKGWKTAA